MKLTLHPCNLPLEHVFTIARGSKAIQPSLLLAIEHDGQIGYGEAPDDTFYGHSVESLSAGVRSAGAILDNYTFGTPAELWELLRPKLADNYFALSAIDIAINDLFGRINKKPLFKSWGLAWENVPASSYTIGIDTVETMAAKLREKPDWPVYKIKLGTEHDLAIVHELRQHTDAVFRVDANCGWSVAETIRNSHELADLNVEFIEQPLPPDSPNDQHRQVFAESALPIIADENCLVEQDVQSCRGLFHGINVKLCKCGGLTPALRMLREARSLGMKTMLGCMVESSVGISAAAHLAPLLDYADLDGAVLIAKDPATGVRVENGQITLADRPGSGVELLPEMLAELSA
ncbi:MAG: dipeptide epimerase [Verrucomicrobiia bacterium]|jgi:L-alanine-DL-glutamate epimerase-like enolase superfamily enzyme